MRTTFVSLLCVTHLVIQQCFALKYIELPEYSAQGSKQNPMVPVDSGVAEVAADQDPTKPNLNELRRRLNYDAEIKDQPANAGNDDKDANMKRKIITSKDQATPLNEEKLNHKVKDKTEVKTQLDNSNKIKDVTRKLHNANVQFQERRTNSNKHSYAFRRAADDKDRNLKRKIGSLIDQTMYDTETKVNNLMQAKENHSDNPAYKIGFLLSMVKRSRDMVNELFNVAVKNKNEWKALEQLKVYELIAHTNTDTSNLVKQLVEIHMQQKNPGGKPARQRLVVL